MAYNFLKSAHKITNSLGCMYDSTDAFTTNFQTNGDVDGWDVYYNTFFYGCWNNVLFGTAADRYCYINRTDNFFPINCEDYYYVKIMMKLTNNNTSKTFQGLTKGKLQWVTLTDSVWDDDKSMEFDITADDQWRLYVINVGPERYWVGELSNIRVYPFIDGWEEDQFAIKYVKISSSDKHKCNNTQCSYYVNYEHPCPGSGRQGSCRAGIYKDTYTTTSGSELLTVNIDDYGPVSFHLGEHTNVSIYEMARIIGNRLSSLSIGGYCFSTVGLSDFDTLEIKSGTTGAESYVVVENTPAAVELGFYTEEGTSITTNAYGTDPATGFEYTASRLLTTSEINKLRDGDTTTIGYTHDAQQYNVEGGRSDYNEIGFFASTEDLVGAEEDTTLTNRNRTLIDWSHPFNNNGKINHIYLYATTYSNSKVKICRPQSDGSLKVVHSLDITPTGSNFYTAHTAVHYIECNILINKGDLLALYDTDVSVGVSVTGVPDATYSQVDGEVTGTFDPGIAYSTGVGGIAVYARSDRYQTTSVLDIDLGDRINIEECVLYGEELGEYYEYNLAMCLDVSWSVDLHSHTHKHNLSDGVNAWTITHTNVGYGKEALSDGKIVAENGVAGQNYSKDSTGVVTTGVHSYFYVNGDAEWLSPEEFSATLSPNIYDFTRDTVTFTLNFPGNKAVPIHKSIMYFKEHDNLRDFSLYYGLGQYGWGGNYLGTQNKLIPEYTYVSMDGIKYDSTNNVDIKAYLFENPCTTNVELDSDGYMINVDNFFAANACDWSVLEHGFNPVNAYSFNIRCDYHNSTKIAELEVYSRVYMEPSMIDNASLLYSAYGDEWKDAVFEIEDYGISAFIGGAPRYMRLEMQTTNTFNLNEVSLITGTHVKTTECDTVLLLDDAKSGIVSNSKEFIIENIYDRPFDLIVDLPKETVATGGIIYWSKLGSQEDIESPDIGPASILRKTDDYKLVTANNQCAINNPCYGLNNLVDGKEAYYSYNGEDWHSYGTLVSGTSLGFHTDIYDDTYKTTLTFDAISSKYYKIVITQAENIQVKDILVYRNGVRQRIRKVFYSMQLGSSSVGSTITSDGSYLMSPTVVLSQTEAIGFELFYSDPLDTIVLLTDTNTMATGTTLTYVSSSHNNDYVLGINNLSVDPQDYYMGFAIDLELRHNLSILRNYGSLAGQKMVIEYGDNVDYSNTILAPSEDISDVVFDNSTKSDASWVRINMFTSDGLERHLDKLGIYPDIAIPYCLGGGYNCAWTSLANILTDYSHPNNVAYGATVTASNYFDTMYPDHIVDGDYSTNSMNDCWAFEGALPEVEVLFDSIHTINKVRLHHGYSILDTVFMNTAFTVSASPTVSGSDFVQIFNMTGNGEHETIHYFDTIATRRLKLVIDAYDTSTISLGHLADTFAGGFLREFEAYSTSAGAFYIDSETWPIVCIDMKDKFTVATHELLSSDPNDDTISWDNDDAFFNYSESLQTDPKKVHFNLQGTQTIIYSTLVDTGNQIGNWEYIFDEDVYFEAGNYIVSFQGYDVDTVIEQGIRLEGNQTVDIQSTNIANNAWADQEVYIVIPEDGYYDVKGRSFISYEYNWGVRNITIYRTSSYSKWLAVTRDTATNYAYDGVAETEGIDTLATVRIYGTESYSPTNYSWWWTSSVSTLSNDFFHVVDDGASLKIEYPASSDEDIVTLMPGDTLGQDIHWSIKDLLVMYLYISDVTKLDVSESDITFGIMGTSGEVYYRWALEDQELVTGWNKIRLKFDDYTNVYPYDEDSFYSYMDSNLNLSATTEDFNYIMLRYKGIGSALTLYLTSLNIERNSFDEDGHFGKALHLTGNDFVQIPVTGLTLNRGTIEFWLKTYYDSYGRDIFNTMKSRTLFSIVNNTNNIVSLGVQSGHWLELAAGHIRRNINIMDADSDSAMRGYFDINTEMHIAVVWSNDGSAMDNRDTLRFYIGDVLVYSTDVTWDVEDTKDTIIRLGGGNTPLAYNYDTPDGGGIFDNLKIHNYCKSSFDINKEGVENDIIYDPNNYLEISSDNINFYDVGSAKLPMTFNQVPAGVKTSIYIRSNKTESGFDNSPKTANLLVSWLTTV